MKRHFGLIALIGVLTTSFVFAQPPRRPMHPPMDQQRQEIMEKLNLNETQQSQMKKLRLDLMKKQIPLRSKIQTMRLDIQEQFLSDKVDRGTIEKTIKAITETEQQMKMNMVAHWFNVNAILTTEQQKIWKNAGAEFGEHMRHGMRKEVRKVIRQRSVEVPEIDE